MAPQAVSLFQFPADRVDWWMRNLVPGQPPEGRTAMSQTKDIRDAVESELSYDPLVDDADISVKNINGDVALNGTVPSYPQYLEAAAGARGGGGGARRRGEEPAEPPRGVAAVRGLP